MSATPLRFGAFEIDPANFQLRRSGRPLRLERIPLEVLVMLVARPGQLVRREEIADGVWGKDVVLDIDNAVNTAIRKVRQALRDDAEHPRYIETVPAKGYRFIGIVSSLAASEEAGGAESGAAPAVVAAAAPEPDTHEDLSGGPEPSRRDPEGERKRVTILVADLGESMERMEDRDPEAVLKLLDPVLDLMTEAIRRYEGTVTQASGNGVTALFGAPLAQEDHAVRACYAALWMQEAMKRLGARAGPPEGSSVAVRIGLNSGEVVVGTMGANGHRQYTAVGGAARLAERTGQRAAPGAILITAETLRLTEGYVLAEPRGVVTAKGLGEGVEVYEVKERGAVRSRLEVAATRGFSQFVGRDAELGQLHRALEQAARGHGQVVAIVGEPGVGKSRLVFELRRSRSLDGWLVLEGRPASYGRAASYLPVIDLLRSYFGIGDRDTHGDIRDKVAEKILAVDRGLESTLPALLALLDVRVEDPVWRGLDPAQRRQRTLDAVKRLLLGEAQAQPLVVVFEDLHWIDAETQAFLDGLVEAMPAARLMLLVDYRPEYRHGWGSKTYYAQIRLDPLAPESGEALLAALLGPDPSLAPLKRLLLERTERNPFFLEESVRSLVETGVLHGERGAHWLAEPVDAVRVPGTVETTLAWRIDRLQAEDKRLLETAAVIGKDVPVALLRAIADLSEEALGHGLGRLQAAEFLYESGRYPDIEYTFKHALTHEVAYGCLLQDRRRALHARIVAAIETLHRDRLDGEIERLAHHAQRGELQEKAVDYLRRAGLRAAARSARPDARVWFEQALGVLETLPESRSTLEKGFEIRLELRPVLLLLGELRRLRERLREAEAIAERLDDDWRRGRVSAVLASAHSHLDELDEALAIGARALEIAGRLGDLKLRIQTTSYLAQAHLFRGDYERAVELATENLAGPPADWVSELYGNAPTSVLDRNVLVHSLTHLGRFAQAERHEAEGIRLIRTTQHAYAVGEVYHAAGWLRLYTGDWATARSRFDRAAGEFRIGNTAIMLPSAVAASAWVLAQVGETCEALDRLREGEQLLDRQARVGAVGFQGEVYHALGCAGLLLGRLDEARAFGNRALEQSSSRRGWAAYSLQLLGDVATHPEAFDAEEGEAYYRQSLALAEPRAMRPLIAHCHLGLGKLFRRTGQRELFRQHLATATAMFREMDMAFWLEQADAAMKELPAPGRPRTNQ